MNKQKLTPWLEISSDEKSKKHRPPKVIGPVQKDLHKTSWYNWGQSRVVETSDGVCILPSTKRGEGSGRELVDGMA